MAESRFAPLEKVRETEVDNMTHYPNIAAAQIADATRSIVKRGGHVVDLEDHDMRRLVEILEDHHQSSELCYMHDLPTTAIDELAAEELAELTGKPNYLAHFARVRAEESECLRALTDILGANTETERQQIIAFYSEGAYPSLKQLIQTATFAAAVAGDYQTAYELVQGVRATPELHSLFVA